MPTRPGRASRPPAKPGRKYIWLGFIGYALPFFIITWGMYFVSSGVAGLLMASIPLFLVVLAHFTLPDERLNLPNAWASSWASPASWC